MAIQDLILIGESINDSVPSTHNLFEENDIMSILALARRQAEKGAAYIDVNVGRRGPEFMGDIIRKIQEVTVLPLVVDTPDKETAAAGLAAYCADKAGGGLPILNSISPLRAELFDLYQITPFRPILMVSERMDNGSPQPNKTAEETYETAKSLVSEMRKRGMNLPMNDCIIDTGIAPVGSDTESQLARVLDSIKLIGLDADLAGIHCSVGLSNFTVMLPSKGADGTFVKSALESAFLTLAMPLGLDMIIGSVDRDYQILSPEHPAVNCLSDVVKMGGYDAVSRVIQFYS